MGEDPDTDGVALAIDQSKERSTPTYEIAPEGG